jgi:L-amino acid N-acyltransferase YncA
MAEIRSAVPADAAAIAAIYDEGIASGLSTFATGPHSAQERAEWLAARPERAPVFVAIDGGAVLGWSALAPFSHRPWYDGVAEYTAYVAGAARGRGLGRQLVEHLIESAPTFGYWKLVGMILPENAPGLALAESCGFRVVGTHTGHAMLGGRWQDVSVVERHLGDG